MKDYFLAFLVLGGVAALIFWGVNATKGIVYGNYSEVIIYELPSKTKIKRITDKGVIREIMNDINKGDREDLSHISFERGPGLLIIFKGEDKEQEVNMFRDTGNVFAENYYIKSEIQIEGIGN